MLTNEVVSFEQPGLGKEYVSCELDSYFTLPLHTHTKKRGKNL